MNIKLNLEWNNFRVKSEKLSRYLIQCLCTGIQTFTSNENCLDWNLKIQLFLKKIGTKRSSFDCCIKNIMCWNSEAYKQKQFLLNNKIQTNLIMLSSPIHLQYYMTLHPTNTIEYPIIYRIHIELIVKPLTLIRLRERKEKMSNEI